MKCKLSIQEKLKDLRVERGLSLQELSEQTGLSRAALGNYETDDYKEITHKAIVILADFMVLLLITYWDSQKIASNILSLWMNWDWMMTP